ncbi:ATP-grasp domain-containing protein [Thiocapsa rosea]|uniref:ATP-grasp domain-containing protein n=1 Tax=Thiocapsa rosea TaxID=69360 RepID=UPI001474142E|nr:ATP-grasp domain-containing protein [Thiocapsa rosea]
MIANSARALAESAVRGGYGVRVLDAFCDEDTRALAPCIRIGMLGQGLDPEHLTAEIARLPLLDQGAGIVFGAGLEASPSVLSGLTGTLRLFGNDPEVLALVGTPKAFFALLDDLEVDYPESRWDPPDADDPMPWLIKMPGGCGGLGVRPWRVGDRPPGDPHYFQRFLAGRLMSLLFIADGEILAVIGYNRLLVESSDPDLPFLYGGAITQTAPDEAARSSIERAAATLVGALGLRGVNNLDFILHDGRPFLLELNPRPSATLALYEGSCEGGWIGHHIRACLGTLPDVAPGSGIDVSGQQVIYAPHDLRIPSGLCWPDWCRDRPVAGSQVDRGAPLCTVMASGPSDAEVEVQLSLRSCDILARIGNTQEADTGSELAT